MSTDQESSFDAYLIVRQGRAVGGLVTEVPTINYPYNWGLPCVKGVTHDMVKARLDGAPIVCEMIVQEVPLVRAFVVDVLATKQILSWTKINPVGLNFGVEPLPSWKVQQNHMHRYPVLTASTHVVLRYAVKEFDRLGLGEFFGWLNGPAIGGHHLLNDVGGGVDDECCICKQGGNNWVLDCGHEFHYSCLCKWKRFASNCPLCRKSVL